MCASPLSYFRDGPPPPRTVLLPDALFFTRSIPVASAAADAAERRREVTNQVELALETLAPFPLEHLYYGYFWTEGAPQALAYAAYRRRFTAEQQAAWDGAELVLPAFAAVLHVPVEPATTLVITTPESLTAIHWSNGPVPSRVASRPLAAEATDEERAAARLALLKEFESVHLLEVTGPLTIRAGAADGEFVTHADALASPFAAAEAAALDVRDKAELAGLRRTRRRDNILWLVAVGCFAAFGLFALSEIAFVGGGLWQKARNLQIQMQAPLVDRISGLADIADHIDALRNKRLYPIEMIRVVDGPRPDTITFLSVSASKTSLNTLSFDFQTPNAAEVPVYRNNLMQLPQVAKGGVDIRSSSSNATVSQFRADVTFKASAIKLSPRPPSSS